MLIIPYKYDIGKIIAKFKKDQPQLWQALNDLNTAAVDLNTIVGNIKPVALCERIQFEISTNATNVQRYVVRVPVDPSNDPIATNLTLTQLIISSKALPAGNDVVDILWSTDRGVTWTSILKVTGTDPAVIYDKATLVTGQRLMTYGVKQFAHNTFNTNDFLRIDWISGTPADDIQVSLIGNYVL